MDTIQEICVLFQTQEIYTWIFQQWATSFFSRLITLSEVILKRVTRENRVIDLRQTSLLNKSLIISILSPTNQHKWTFILILMILLVFCQISTSAVPTPVRMEATAESWQSMVISVSVMATSLEKNVNKVSRWTYCMLIFRELYYHKRTTEKDYHYFEDL